MKTNEKALPWDSKIGGKPYLLEDDEYPVSCENEPFKFLIQINFNDLPENDYLPTQGLLQFFLNNDYSYDEDDQPFLIKFIPHVIKEDKKLNYDEEDDFDDDLNEYFDEEDDFNYEEFSDDYSDDLEDEDDIKIDFQISEDHINPSCLEWQGFTNHLASCLYNYQSELEDYESIKEDNLYLEDLDFILDEEEVVEVRFSNKLFGYASNEEEDIRIKNDAYKNYLLLLQYSLFDEEEKKDRIIKWFINPLDLEKLDFSKVICSYYK
ncbi:MAG: DUF1963 domain-containing protein [Bacilli bacterium]|nr:DUF1963 domain-containing protein [Bacilli bacterium]